MQWQLGHLIDLGAGQRNLLQLNADMVDVVVNASFRIFHYWHH